MHMISKKDLRDAEMDTLTKSCSPTIVVTANGEVQTHEEAIVYVKELDIFLIDHPRSSSRSSTSPTTTVSSDSETRAREDLSGIDSHPVPVSLKLTIER